ncbi:MAG TPA: YdeI/OmpD-associated family protein [Planctomycetota bacterium]|nr:YdeI/OmpD-associated family protein [Planctomycetota bacterium]
MKNPQVDAYIAQAAPFARPILRKVRALFHRACPAVEETLKWGVPGFERKGMLGGMAAFKRHARFGFWRADVLPDPAGLLRARGPLGIQVADVSTLPSDRVLLDYIRAAVRLNESGPPPRARTRPARPPKVPAGLLSALRKDPKAFSAWKAFSPSCRREYAEWIAEAKRDATRRERIATAVAWIRAGKSRHWKYRR